MTGSPGSGTGGASSGNGAASGAAGAFGLGGSQNGGGFTSAGGTAGSPPGGTTGAGGSVIFDDPCGDGIQFVNACDDGNTVSGDGCSATCEIEPGYTCPIPGQPCRQPRCGDGHQDQTFVPDVGSEPAASGGSTSSAGQGGTTVSAGGAPNGTYYFEQCDDGNVSSGDGCSASCEIEPGYVCPNPGESCRQPRCGDGYQDQVFVPDGSGGSTGIGGSTGNPVQGGAAGLGTGGGANGTFYSEQCDDANTSSGDGCSPSCEVERGYVCQVPGEPCRQVRCGDGFIDFYVVGYEATGTAGSTSSGGGGLPGAGGTSGAGGAVAIYQAESCDDGNAVAGDGCDATCQIEAGYVCSGANVPCRKPRCGDGIVDYYYPDANAGSGGSTSTAAGGATATAGFGGTTATAGFGGTMATAGFGGTTATAGFGGTMATGGTAGVGVEQCDDGNTVSGDGCSATCALE